MLLKIHSQKNASGVLLYSLFRKHNSQNASLRVLISNPVNKSFSVALLQNLDALKMVDSWLKKLHENRSIGRLFLFLK